MPAVPRRHGWRRWCARGAFLTFGLILAFTLCEVGFRVVERIQLSQAGELWAVYDEQLGWRLNPKYGDHSADGLRDRPVAPKAGRTRLLFLGDSVLYYGDDVDDTVPGRLRAELSRPEAPGNAGGAIDVVNAGVKGYTNRQQLVFLRERGLALQPDLVGVGFVLNDCHRMLHQFRVEDGKIVGQNYEFSSEVIEDQSWAYRTLRSSRVLVWLRRRLPGVEASPASGYSFDHRPDFSNAWEDEPWTAVEAQLLEMRDLGRKHGFPVFLVVFPFADQYRPDYLERDRDYVLKPQRLLAEICSRLGIPCLDLFPHLDGSADFDEDRVHLVASGRAKSAARIAEFLDAQKLLPARR